MLVDGGGGGAPSPTTSPNPPPTSLSSRGKSCLDGKPSACTLRQQKATIPSSPSLKPFAPSAVGEKGVRGGLPDASQHTMDVHARLANTPPHVLIRSISSLSQTSIRPRTPDPTERQEENVGSVPALRKGILLQARDRLFSRWKERFFVLTRDYLACFRRGSTKYSEMGSFIFKVNLATVDYVGWEDRRGGPVLSISLPREGKMLLRAKSGLDQWYRELREATAASRSRRNALRRGSSTTHLHNLSNNNMQMSPQFKAGGSHPFNLSDSTPEIVQLCESVCRDSSPGNARNISRTNRFSLMTNIEVGSCEGDLTTPPSSVNSHKFSSSTSSTSGSGGSSSLASSPSLRSSSAWPRPSSPVRPAVGDNGPRTRFSLYEGPRETIAAAAKTRHSVCVEPRGLHADITSVFRRRGPSLGGGVGSNSRHSICGDARDPYSAGAGGSRTSLCLQPRNPLLELLESSESGSALSDSKNAGSSSKLASPAKSEPEVVIRASPPVPIPSRDGVDTSPSPPSSHRPRAHSTSVTPERAMAPRSRTNLALFRHSGIFN